MRYTFFIRLILLTSIIIGYNAVLYSSAVVDMTSKLETLKELVDPKDLSTIEAVENKAKKQSNHLYLAYAYYSKSVYYNMNFAEDSIKYYTQEGLKELDIFKEQKHNISQEELDFYQLLKIQFANSIVQNYLSDNKYELALISIERMLGESNLGQYSIFEYEAYYLLGVCYLHLKKGAEALSSFEKANEQYEKNTKNRPFSYHRHFRGMSHAYLILKDYDNMIAINDKVESLIDRDFENHKEQAYFYYQSKYVVSNEVALALVLKGELKNARKRLDQSAETFTKYIKDSPLKHAYYEVEAQYYSALGDHQKAKKYINYSLGADHAKTIYKNINNYITGNLIKADILDAAGDRQEAYKLLRQLYQLNDSVNSASFSNQVAEIQTLYKVDKLEYESEQNKLKIRTILYALIGSILISLLLIYIIYTSFKNSRILKEKNKRLLQQYSELDNRNKIITDLQHAKQKEFDDIPIDTDPYQKLISKLELYLNESQAYRRAGLSREELALVMSTNRQYLIEAIKEKTGKTFNEYIYGFRLKYAYEQITTNLDKSISEIYFDAGFQTKGTFNRVFKEAFGMTPSELRNAIT